jgi:CO/xanthine dehydrogenase FAD-binding subunit
VVLVSGGQAGELEREEVRLDEFYLGYKKMRLRAGQLVETVRVPRREYAFTLFEKVGARRAQAITKVGVAVTKSDAGWRVVANSVAPVVKRCRAVEDLLESGAPVRSPLGFAGALAKDVSPIDDIRSTAAYRRAVLARVLYFGLRGRAGVV